MKLTHLLAAADLNTEQIRDLFALARSFEPKVDQGEVIPLLQGKTVVNLFFENSTRTRASFELAARRLGANVLFIAATGSSVEKGETLIDTARNIEAMKAHCLVVRHASSGSPGVLARALRTPIVNAGDGFHEHPTQGLLDAFTMEEKLKDLKGKHVLIVGDIAHSRVARSNIHVLKKLGAHVTVCGPPTLLPPSPQALGVEATSDLNAALPKADVVMALRIQLERQNKMQIPSISEYAKFWGINAKRASTMKPQAFILHPGPINRGVELDPEVADGERSVILDQVGNGVLIRMAVLAAVAGSGGGMA